MESTRRVQVPKTSIATLAAMVLLPRRKECIAICLAATAWITPSLPANTNAKDENCSKIFIFLSF
jgi:hypothetical protein